MRGDEEKNSSASFAESWLLAHERKRGGGSGSSAPVLNRDSSVSEQHSPTLFLVSSRRTYKIQRTSCEYQCNGRYYHYITPEHIIIVYQTGYINY